MSELSVTTAERRLAPPVVARGVWPQLTVLSGQLIAGIGFLLLAVVLARVLDPGDYAGMVAFLALYVLLHMPAAALTAAGALAPDRLASLAPKVAAVGTAAGVILILASGPVGRFVGMSTGLIVALGFAVPAAGLLSLRRGLAYGHEQHRRVTASLVTDAAVRLVAGVILALALGPVGAAAATVLGGYAALWVYAAGAPAWRFVPPVRLAPPGGGPVAAVTTGRALSVGLAFASLAVLQATDLLVANRVLDAASAAQFGVVSTLGGAAFFATSTIPLVLMPAAVRGRSHAGSTAVVLTAAVGVSVAAAGAVVARQFLLHAFGEEYVGVAHLVGPYLLAMALLGIVRVQVARRGAAGASRGFTVAAIVAAIAAELLAVALWARSVDAVVATTLFTTAGLALVLEMPHVLRHPTVAAAIDRRRTPATWSMVGLCAVALGVRVATTRGLWVDEAISVAQAQMSFGQMINDMTTTDVHPPLHHALLWLTVRVFGSSEFAVRLPSLLAGVALVPVMYWVGRVVYDRRTGWVAAILAAIAPFCVWYSQEARMYSLFMLLAAVAVGAQVQAIRRGRIVDWVLYGVATALLLWTQYFAMLPVVVQQVAFVWVIWRDRRDPARWRALLKGWALSALIIVLFVMPMLPILRTQLEAYGNRGSGLVPGQAGAGSSVIGGTISIYAVGANLIWAVLGYHADGVMVQVAALWPLLMLLGLVLLGRGRSGRSMLLLALVVVPMAALFIVGSMKRDLFELRYFSGAVPAMLLLGARVVTATTVRRAAVAFTACVLTVFMVVGLVDQQLNGANPRLYDFEGAFSEISSRAGKGDIVLYEPSYLAEVVEYYAPDLEARPVGSQVPDGAGLWVLATERVLDAEDTSARLGTELANLEQERDVLDIFERPNVRVWELR